MGRHSSITRTRQHRAAPAVFHRLSNTYLLGGLLLIFAFGITAAAVEEAWSNHHLGWLAFFVAALVAVLGLYFELVTRWIELVGLND